MGWTEQSWSPEQPRFAVDLTGDRKADIVGFGMDGVWVALNDGGGGFQPPWQALSDFSFQKGWRVAKHPRLMADLTGDGRADIVGFGDAGVWIALNRGDGTFRPAQFMLAQFGVNQGWQVDVHPRLAVDLTGDGKADLVGFGIDGVWVALNNGDGSFQPAKFVLANMGVNQGWHADRHPRYAVDTTGDGRADLVGFGDDGVWVALNNGSGAFGPAQFVLANFGFNQGWRLDHHLRVMADVSGDRRADVVGFGDAGLWTATGNGSGSFGAAAFVLADLGFNNGWRPDRHPRLLGDLTGDGKADVVGFGDAGIWVAVSGTAGARFMLAEFGFNKGWQVGEHPRMCADLTGDGKDDIVGFGNDGVWTALGNGDGSFQAARFVLADFGRHSAPQLKQIMVEFHTQDDDLNSDSLLHIFVKNRSNTTSTPEDADNYIGNLLAYQAHDADWFNVNPYLGFAQNASKGQSFGDQSTTRINVPLRSRPIPRDEIVLPVVNIHLLAERSDHWVFDYTTTFLFDDGSQFSAASKVNGVDSIVLDQDNRNHSGICTENLVPPPPTIQRRPVTESVLTGVTIEFHTHNDDRNADTQINVHVVNRLSATASQDIAIALDVLKGQHLEDTDDPSKVGRAPLLLVASPVHLRDIVLPVVYINIAQSGEDQWIFDYRITYFFGQDEPYTSTTSGVVLDQSHHKHMGVYNGRPFPTLAYPKANLVPLAIDRVFHPKTISLAVLQKKLDELFNSRQGLTPQTPPLMKLRLDSTAAFGDPLPETYADVQSIGADPPPPDGTPLPAGFWMGVKYGHSPIEIGQIHKAFGFVGFFVRDINSKSITLNVNSGNVQTPLTLEVKFETDGPVEVGGTQSMDIIDFEIRVLLTLRFDETQGRVDLMGWVDDIQQLKYTSLAPVGTPQFQVTGHFLGNPVNATTVDPTGFRSSLIGEALHVGITTSEATDLGGALQKSMREQLFDRISKPDPITRISMRDSLNATLNSWLLGGVIASGNAAPLPFPNPCRLVTSSLKDDMLTLNYIGPERSFVFQPPPQWPAPVDFSPGTLANIDHIIVLTQENRSFDHMLGYLSLPPEKGGLGRREVDGLKGGEFNMFKGQRCESFRFAAGDTIFSPGPPNGVERVLAALNGGRMDGFVQSQADECGPATAHRVMGYHTADNVPTYDALARDFAIGHRWFASHPGPTFPNRYYELTGRPNIDAWGTWELGNSKTLRAEFTDTVFDHLFDRGVSWRYFEHGYSFLRFFERHTFDAEHLVGFDDPLKGFEALARAGALPSVSFIDPHFVDFPPDSACDEPPSDIKNGQAFIRRLVETVVASPKWNKTLLIITYDEHGGFYDHVPPVAAAPVAPGLFATTGARVPAFVVSPWVGGSAVFGHDSVAGGPPLHFDHTSILKTIARRFMSSKPPFMGARYAAAHDLSEVLGNTLRAGPFRPFLPYNLTCAASKLCLDVRGADTHAGAFLQQFTPNGTPAQDFRFEDAGGGFFYIRTLAGLYVTADVPPGAATGPGTSFAIKHDIKYAPGPAAARSPDFQKWRLAASSVVVANQDVFGVSCRALAGKLLQPAGGSASSGAAVVLADPSGVHSPVMTANPWHVGSVLLPPPGQVLR